MAKDDEYMHEINRLEAERDYWLAKHAKVDTECKALRRALTEVRVECECGNDMVLKLQNEIAARREEYERLRGAMASDDNRLLTAARRVDLDFGCDSAEAMADKIEWLRSRLAEITDAHRVVMEEKCHADERHCTCAPVLRAEIERLRAALTEMEQMHETLETENNERGREIERTRHLAGALLDRVMELDPVATVWRESLIERWPWLECGRDAAGGERG